MVSEESIRTIIADCSGIPVDSCLPTSNVHEIGVDSLTLMSIVAHMEAKFSADIDDAAVLRLMEANTVGEITAILKSCNAG